MTIPTGAAIANAVYNAVGVRITDMPITPEKILRAFDEKRLREEEPDELRVTGVMGEEHSVWRGEAAAVEKASATLRRNNELQRRSHEDQFKRT